MAQQTQRHTNRARSAEARESQLISMAYDLVEQRLRDGSATSQETTHFLKAGSLRNRLELEKMKQENEMIKARTESLKSTERIEELYSNALSAMKEYSGSLDEEDPDDY